jgi:type IV pilus assembly protein PilY1
MAAVRNQLEIRCSPADTPAPEQLTKDRRWPVRIALALGLALLLQVPTQSYAGQLSLATSPLFLGTAVEPNIFLLSDDSGSMDWDVMTLGDQGRISLVGATATTDYSYVLPTADNNYSSTSSNGRILPSEEAVQATTNMPADAYGVWRGRFSGHNVMYYNPEVVYTPWSGVNNAGNLYANVNPLAAPLDPFNAASATVDLTALWSWTADNVPQTTSGTVAISVTGYYPARYYLWTDSNTNGVVDAADGHTRVEISPANEPFAHTSGKRSDCANPLSCSYTEEIQNFANWFSYYRRREATAKNAIGKLVTSVNSVRLGYGTLHNNSGASNILITPMNPDPTIGNKRALLDGIYKTQSNNGTPLRQTLRDVGRYYECVSGNLMGASGSSCPILPAAAGGTCQQNFTVLMTDGFYNGSSPSLTNNDGDNNTAFDSDPSGPYGDTMSNTLGDVAMHYYERDLAPGLLDEVPITAGIDNAKHQHMVTYTVAYGVSGELDPFDTKTPGNASDTDPTDPGFSWPDPFSGTSAQQDARRIDDLWHAAYDSRGVFLSANNASELTKSMADAIANITDRTGSAAAVALNSASLSTDTTIFQARFNSGESSGQLRAIPLDANGNIGPVLWDAGEVLKSQTASNRQIITSDGSTGVPFRWFNLSQPERDALNKNAQGIADPVGSEQGQARLQYLRGDTSGEGVTPTNFRVRNNGFKLGDIVHSAPVFVGAPPFLYTDTLESAPYSSFRVNQASRTPMVYVGANDGMLHGFNADTGEEELAYVPARLYSTLTQLTAPAYVHRYYVDGAPTAGDAFYNAAWHTVLVGTLRAGGQGIFALDVTDPATFSEANADSLFMWEFSDATDADLGYTFGEATIAKMQNGRWAAIFANGYNNTEADGNASSTGNAVLYIVDIETGALIKKIDTQHGKAQSADGTTPNGLSTPAVVDVDSDSVADLIYAGDLQGNLWKFDVQSPNPTNWDVAAAAGPTLQPLFTATDAGGTPQPITVRPEVGSHPDGLNGFMVYFGTGKYMETGDNSTTPPQQVQTFYGIWDQKGASVGNHTPVNKADLQTQTISTATYSGQTVRTVSDNPITSWGTAAGSFMGWQVDMPLTAEKIVADPVLRTGRIIFPTLVPNDSPCAVGGTSWLMELNFRNGGPPAFPVFDLNDDGTFNTSDMTSGGQFIIGIDPGLGIMPKPVLLDDPAKGRELKITTGTGGDVKGIANNPGPDTAAEGRRSWRQMQ